MKNLRYKILVWVCLILLTGCQRCKKEPTPARVYTIKGRAMQTCTLPYKNQTLSFSEPTCRGLLSGGGGSVGSTTTDGNGYFSLDYDPECYESIDIANGNLIYTSGQATGENGIYTKDVGTIYVNPTINVFVRVKATNAMTNLDTFYYANPCAPNPSGAWSKLAGPFINQKLFTCTNYSGFDAPAEGRRSLQFVIRYMKRPYDVNGQIESFTQNFNLCSSTPTQPDSMIIQIN